MDDRTERAAGPDRSRDRRTPSFRLRDASAGLLLAALVIGADAAALRAQDPLSLADPELTREIQELVIRHSPELNAGGTALEAARARAGGAGFSPPAVLSGEMDDVPDGFDVGDASFRLEIGREFLTGGRSAAARALAAADIRVAETGLAAAEQRLRATTLRSLARIMAASHAARRLASEDSLLASAEALLRDRFSVGDARYVEVLRLRTERLRIQTDRAEALAQTRAEREVLVGLAGPEGSAAVAMLADSAAALADAASEYPPVPPPPGLDSLLMLAGPILLAEAAVDQAEARRDAILAEQRPRLSAAIGAQRRVEGGGSTVGPVLSASVTLPFTAGERNRALAEASEREVEAARADVGSAAAEVRSLLQAELARYEAARDRVSVFDAALLEGAREEREAALGAYRSGEMSLIELLDFERALARAEIERLRARVDVAEAYANLISATSGGR